MSGKESQGRDQQFAQEVPQRRESVNLDKRYKSIGISAVSAATSIKTGKTKKPSSDQMA